MCRNFDHDSITRVLVFWSESGKYRFSDVF